jgi:hypothetical protein
MTSPTTCPKRPLQQNFRSSRLLFLLSFQDRGHLDLGQLLSCSRSAKFGLADR